MNWKKKKPSGEQTVFIKVSSESTSFVKASYLVAYIIAKRGKSYLDGEFVKKCFESMR